MLSKEFTLAVKNHNLLRTRIMLKDSLIIDPTFSYYEEMITYAKQEIPDVVVPFDGEYLEENSLKWDRTMIDMELVRLINNFSEERVSHIKKMISKTVGAETKTGTLQKEVIPKAEEKKVNTSKNDCRTEIPLVLGKIVPKETLQQIMEESRNVFKSIKQIEDTGKWENSNVRSLRRAAKRLSDLLQSI